jgi:uncharacterized protein
VPAAEFVYLDSSAFVKLVLAEPETSALVAALDGVIWLISSEILEIEALRATRRGGGDTDAVRAQLDGVRMLSLSSEVRALASELEPSSMRSLDAIHLATALSVGDRLQGLYTYDERMARAAGVAGLDVQAPR